jgi:hypothetical protein
MKKTNQNNDGQIKKKNNINLDWNWKLINFLTKKLRKK